MARTHLDDGAEHGVLTKLLRVNWLLAALLAAAAAIGFLMLYSVAGGSIDPWARAQIVRFSVGFGVMVLVALIDLRLWRQLSWPIYLVALALLVLTEVSGEIGMGAQRWLKLGPLQLQPSELMKLALVMALAAFYHRLEPKRISRPIPLLGALAMVAGPAALVLIQPDLGTALLLLATGAIVLFLAGVAWWVFAGGGLLGGGAVWAVMASRGTDWQLLKDYQYRRIETFLDPTADPLGGGYHIIQSTIAIGSGGLDGKGFLGGSQTQLSFLPEPHTDFIFTTLAEEFGFRGGLGLILLYLAITFSALLAARRARSVFGRLLASGVAAIFFLSFAVNIAMVTGLAPVVGVPLPLVSYGGTSMLALMAAFGLVMSAEVHREDALLR